MTSPSVRSPSSDELGRGGTPATLLAVAALISAIGLPTIVTQCDSRRDRQADELEELRKRVEVLEERERARSVADDRHEVTHMRERQEIQAELQGFYSRVRE